jgi:hypothetical protein
MISSLLLAVVLADQCPGGNCATRARSSAQGSSQAVMYLARPVYAVAPTAAPHPTKYRSKAVVRGRARRAWWLFRYF